MDAIPTPQPPRKRRIWRWLFGIFVFLLIVGGGVYAVCQWRGASELKRAVAELDRTDPGWRLEDIEAKRKVIPPERNSALHILAIKEAFEGQSTKTEVEEKLFANVQPERRLNEPQVSFLEAQLAKFQRAVLMARALKDMPEGRFPITSSGDGDAKGLPHLRTVREVRRILCWDLGQRVHALDADGALESCLVLLHAARSIGDEPGLSSQSARFAGDAEVVGGAERILAQGQPSALSLKALQAGVDAEILELSILPALRGERGLSHQLMQAYAEGNYDAKLLSLHFGVKGAEALLIRQLPGYLAQQHAELLRLMNQLIEAADLPQKEQDAWFESLEETRRASRSFVLVVTSFLLERKIRIHRGTQALLRCTAAGLAAERFRLIYQRWPVELEELVKEKLLDAVPIDPYNKQPLQLEKVDDGLIIYSMGRDIQYSPGARLCFRLWDVASRRQPPLPPVLPAEQEVRKKGG